MIQATKLLEAIKNRICNWEVIDVFYDESAAKKYAAKAFIHAQGVKVKQYHEHGWVVLSWRIKGEL